MLEFTPSPHSWDSFNRYHFYIYIHVYTVFAPYSPSYALFPPPPQLVQSPPHPLLGMTHSTLLFLKITEIYIYLSNVTFFLINNAQNLHMKWLSSYFQVIRMILIYGTP
jgi:hypothetical protein